MKMIFEVNSKLDIYGAFTSLILTKYDHLQFILRVFLSFHFLRRQKYPFNITNWILSDSNELERILIPY
jgi:hypothetical protein